MYKLIISQENSNQYKFEIRNQNNRIIDHYLVREGWQVIAIDRVERKYKNIEIINTIA